MTSHAMNKVKTPLSANVKRAIETFEAYARKHDNYGACDTEAGWNFHNVIRKAVQALPFPDYIDFELYSYEDDDGKDDDGVPYSVKRKRSRQINAAMTNKARNVYMAILRGPMSNADALRSYAWRVSF